MTSESVEIKELRKHEQSFSAFFVVMEYGASFPLPFRTGGDCRTSNNINLSMQFAKHGKHVNKESKYNGSKGTLVSAAFMFSMVI
jgi:hypothetical protein